MRTTTTHAEGDARPFALLAAGVIGRLPAGMVPIAVLLAARGGGSVALGATATAVVALCTAAAGPLAGRLVDRGNARTVLAATAALYPLAIALLAWAAHTGEALALLAAAALAGVSTPPVGPLVRSQLPRLVPDHALGRLFAAEAASTELVWIVGPLLVAGLTALASPGVALAAAGAFGAFGALLCRSFATGSPVARRGDGPRARPALGRIGVVLGGDALSGMAIGVLLVALTEATVTAGVPGWTGVMIALWSAGSLLGGIVAGARTSRRPLAFRYVGSMALLALATAPLTVVASASIPSLRAIAIAAFVAGLPLAVVAATANGLIASLVPAAARAEAFAWSAATVAVAGASGSALAGPIIATGGVRAAALTSAGLLGAASVFVAVRRTMLEPRCTPSPTLDSIVCAPSPTPMVPTSST